MLQVTASGLVTQRFLRGMDIRQLDELARAASEVMFPAGQRIFTDGDYAANFWLIQSGYVDLDVPVPGVGRVAIDRVGSGRLVGWSWLVPPYQWVFGAVCLTEVKAFQFNTRTVRHLCAADPALGNELNRRVFQSVTERLEDATASLTDRSLEMNPYVAA